MKMSAWMGLGSNDGAFLFCLAEMEEERGWVPASIDPISSFSFNLIFLKKSIIVRRRREG